MTRDPAILTVATADGTMPVETFRPASGDRHPAVILFMDAPGIRDELRDAAQRIADAGFVCALPDLYYRVGHIRLDLTRRSETHAAIYRLLGDSLDNRLVAADTAALLDGLAVEPGVEGPRVGCVGFSIGGRFALQAPGLFPGRIGAVATICGTGLVTDRADSPHRQFETAPTPLALALDFAAEDPAVPTDVIPMLRAIIAKRGFAGDVAQHPGTRHGYSFALRPMFDPAAAEASWGRTIEALTRGLTGER